MTKFSFIVRSRRVLLCVLAGVAMLMSTGWRPMLAAEEHPRPSLLSELQAGGLIIIEEGAAVIFRARPGHPAEVLARVGPREWRNLISPEPSAPPRGR